mgnify:CR=1 FL=1
MQGLIHLYFGDGKGKTTAAVGLSVRAAGAGKRVLFAQFLKDGSSSELNVLRALQNVEVACCEQNFGFFKSMDGQTKAAARLAYTALLEETLQKSADGVALLVLDEAVAACNHGLIEEARLLDFLHHKPEDLEVVLTGRDPSQRLLDAADYVTEMRKCKHPFERGIAARRGVEF